MKKPRYLLKRTKFALFTGIVPLILGFLLIFISISLISFSLWADSLTVDKSLLPMANNPPIFYDIDGNEVEYKSDNYVKPDEIPDNLKYAFIALEDKRFYDHNGYDTYRIAGAIAKNIAKGGVVEGASTITQQLVKNTHLTFEKTMSRKLKEIALSTKLEQMYTKDEILSMYLSVIYFGNGAYGVKSASKMYFDKEVKDLTLAECATLAGIIKNPTKYSPKSYPENCKNRRNVVLDVMEEQGYITRSQMLNATNENMRIVENRKRNLSKFFINLTIDEICKKLNITKYQLDNSGYKIYTTYSPQFQEILYENGNLNGNFSKDGVDNSAVIIDNKTGFVLAYDSSLSYEIFRQGGSTLKPLVVYAPALESNAVTLATPIDDGQMKIGNWTPKNYNGKYVGISNIRDGIKQSSNTVAVKVATYLGEEKIYQYAKKFGLNITETDKNLTLSLGATEKGQSPLQLARAYSTFANNGIMLTTTFLRYITDNGRKIYSFNEENTQIISSDTAYLVEDCLVDTVKNGTAKTLNTLPFIVASKTGTVSNNNGQNTDGWNVSFCDKYTLAVWHGNANETGGGHPTKHAYNIWKKLYEKTEKSTFQKGFERPNSVILLPIDTYSTSKLNSVTLATDNTPQKYVKNELFKQSNTVNFEKSLFENCYFDFDISVQNELKRIKISFKTDEIYSYHIVRRDAFGNNTIAIIDGTGKTATFYDNPLFLPFPIEYEIFVCVKGNTPQDHVVGFCKKTVIVKM